MCGVPEVAGAVFQCVHAHLYTLGMILWVDIRVCIPSTARGSRRSNDLSHQILGSRAHLRDWTSSATNFK